MIKKVLGAMLLLCTAPLLVFAQYKNNKWLVGIGTQFSQPFNGSKLEFTNNSLNMSYDPRSMWLFSAFSAISPIDDAFFLYSNGSAVCNQNHDTISNGYGLSPGGDSYWEVSGYPFPGSLIFIPKQPNGHQMYLIHGNSINAALAFPPINIPRSLQLYYSIVDPFIGPIGTLTQKNQVLINDTTEVGNILACRHANGRDWWILVKKFNSNIYYTVLLGPQGPISVDQQIVAGLINTVGGQACFSPDGTKYAVFSNSCQFRLYDFDRCNGQLSNLKYKHITINSAGSTSFSPNSRYVYISSLDSVWQFDTYANDVLSSQTLIGSYDGFVDSTGNSTSIWWHWLAPDGKIYIVTGSVESRYLHVINNPDEAGSNCNFTQHSIYLPTYNDHTIPTYVNLDLKQVPGSICDTLGVGNEELKINNLQLKIAPNPSNGSISIEFPVQETSGMLYVYDVNGKLVYSEYVSPYSYIKNINLQGKLSNGMYALSMVFGQQRYLGKMVVE
jgi:hypothetical protein